MINYVFVFNRINSKGKMEEFCTEIKATNYVQAIGIYYKAKHPYAHKIYEGFIDQKNKCIQGRLIYDEIQGNERS